MKKLIFSLAAAALCSVASADEGMWLLPYLQKMNIAQMQTAGCRLNAEQIYSTTSKTDLQDAIVIFGAGCTGEVVSDKGLVLTNHHCGYGSIQALSSLEHDYLKNGYWAGSFQEEIPVEGLEIRFVRDIIDVTEEVLGNVPSTAMGEERANMVSANTKKILEEYSKINVGEEFKLVPFFGGNQYFLFNIETFKDIRFVGAPPTSIGKFGGETDNWMWPRHTGDFSVFRIYASKDNKPAAYSKDNVPYTPKKHLNISLKGYKDGDFTMIMGFPGRTQRYMTSYEIDYMLDVDNPQRIFIRGERQAILKEAMEASDEVRIKYASKYARSSNYWKNSIGMSRGIKKLGVKYKKEAEEASFQAWANANTMPTEGYMDALPMMKESLVKGGEAGAARQYIAEALLSSVEILRASNLTSAEDVAEFYKDLDVALDKKVAKRMFAITKQNCRMLPTVFAEIDQKFGGDTDAYVDWLYANSAYSTEEGAVKMVADKEARHADPAYVAMKSVYTKYMELSKTINSSRAPYNDGHRLYIAGLMRQFHDRAWYSDANSTIRLTYGNIKSYVPQDGVKYDYMTTLRGVIEKEDPSNPNEFTVPERLKEIYATKDYGRYATRQGEMPVAFLSTCDITGGNSGSPVMNAKGELIGLAFDGNWEAMSGDVAFEPALQRTISVDIRYVLLIIDKFAGAQRLIDEMTIK